MDSYLPFLFSQPSQTLSSSSHHLPPRVLQKMQISGILKCKPMPATPTNPLLRQILKWGCVVPDSVHKKRILLRFFSQQGPWTLDIICDDLDFSLWMGQMHGKGQSFVSVCVG